MNLPNWARGSLLVLFGAFLWGTLVVFTKGASHLEPMSVATLRAGMAALGCFLWFGLKAPAVLKVRLRTLALLAVYGGVTAAFLYGGFTVALRYLSVATAEVIFFTFPLFTTLAGIFVLRERPAASQILACFLIIVGVFSMTALTGRDAAQAAFPLPGIAAAVISLVGMTLQSLVGRKNARKNWLPTETLFSYAQLFGFLWLALYKSLTSGWGDIAAIAPGSWLLLCYMGFVSTLMGYGAYNLGLRYIEAATASMLASFEMVTAVALAALFLGTPPTAGEIVGCIVILAALVLGTRSAKHQGSA